MGGMVGESLTTLRRVRQVDASQLDKQEHGRAKERPCPHGGRSNVQF